MKKVIIMLILALNFVCYADGFTYMKPEEAEALINYYNSSTFPQLTLQDIVTLPGWPGLGCQAGPEDYTIDNVAHPYIHYSLSNCNGKNYVSSIKLQTGGTCTKWAATAATEIVVSTKLKDYIQFNTQFNTANWSPVNLSEAWTIVTTENDFGNEELLIKMSEKGTVHGYYFPFYSKQNNDPQGNPIGWENIGMKLSLIITILQNVMLRHPAQITQTIFQNVCFMKQKTVMQ